MRRIIVGAIIFGLALVGAGPATPARAAGSIGISDDGVTFGSAYPGTIFGSLELLVPLDTESETFYIRNETADPAFLRIVLLDVTYSDAAYGAALSVNANTPAKTGTPRPLTAATPCVVLVEGETIQAGAVVPVTTALSLGDLNGSEGQDSTADLSLRIELHDTSTGSLPATTCTLPPGTPSTEIVVVPPTRPTGGGGGKLSGAPATTDPPAVTPDPEPTDPGELDGENQGNIEPNTWLLYEERWWFVMLLAFVVGSLCFMIVDWQRHRRGRKDETETGA